MGLVTVLYILANIAYVSPVDLKVDNISLMILVCRCFEGRLPEF